MGEARRQSLIATTAVALVTTVMFAAMILFNGSSNPAVASSDVSTITVTAAGKRVTLFATATATATATDTVTTTLTPTIDPTSDPNAIDYCEVIKVAGKNLQFTCYNAAGEIIPAGLITVEPEVIISNITKFVTLPTKTITLPVKTVTIRPPRITRSVFIPGPTTRVTLRNNITETVQGPTRTVTRVVSVTGQPSTSYVTVTPSPIVKTVTETKTQTKIETVVKRILLGTLVSLVLAALGILAMFLGYIMGQTDAKRNEDNFLQSLRAKVRGESEHSI